MKRSVVILVVLVSVSAIATVTVGGLVLIRHATDPTPAVSCGTGSDLASRSCRESENSCREDDGFSAGSADGVGFSYDWTCEDGTLTSFRFV
jgi:hypothetical protein